MSNNGIPSTFQNCFIFLLVIIVGGCSSAAPVQESHSSTTPAKSDTNLAQKTSDLSPGEGLWLVSQLTDTLYDELQSKRLQVPADSIYNPNGSALSNAVLKINGSDNSRGTGVFISDRGLILTNYRTALGGIANASTLQQNYLKNGYFSETTEQEIPLEGYSLHIPIEQKDVTSQINSQLPDSLTYRQRQNQIGEIKKELIAQRKSNDNIVVEINDVWGGNRQIMSVYKKIEDVRLVHTPSQTTAFPSGDEFSQTWPSNGADYALLRAYADSNGNSKTYDQNNIPYSPKKHFAIETSDIEAGDQTIALGYPGETQRQESSYAINFYQDHRNPVLIKSYKARLKAQKHAARNDSAKAIRNAPQRKNIQQNLTYFNQLQSSFLTDSIAHQRQSQEQEFKKWVKEDSLRNIRYRRVLPQLDQAYRIASQNGNLLFALVQTLNNSKLLQAAGLYNSYYEHISDSANTELSSSNKSQLLKQHQSLLNEMDIDAQTDLLADMLYILSTLPEGNVIMHLMELFENPMGEALANEIKTYLAKQQEQSLVYNPQQAQSLLELPADSVQKKPTDDLIKLYQRLLENYQFSRKNYSQHIPYANPAQELYVQGLREFNDNLFPYPDANGTLRLTLGQVEGYTTPDGTTHSPFTQSENKKINFLTSNDITGGAYGSPVLNEEGKLVGLTYYRTPEGMGSDFIFNSTLHRTINVSIGHIINQMSEFSGSQKLLKEMQF